MSAIVETKGFGKNFGARSLWSGLDLSLGGGTILALRGQSGSGKSTFLHCLGGLAPYVGKVLVGGVEPAALRGAARRRFLGRQVTYLFQNYGLVDEWTVAQNLRLVQSQPRSVAARQEVLERVNLSAALLRQPVFRLSGGEQQRVALARCLLKGGQLILVDEPTSALDDANAGHLVTALRSMAADSAVVIVATHDPRVFNSCDEQLTLGDLGIEDGC